MCSNKSYPTQLIVEVEFDNESIFISFNVIHDTVLSENTGAWVVPFQFIDVSPRGFLSFSIP